MRKLIESYLIFRFVEERVVVDVFFPDSFFKAF